MSPPSGTGAGGAANGTPAAEIDIDAVLVHRLLQDQHPDLAGLPLRFLGSGWDNALFRLGEDWTVRLPRRQSAAELILHEQEWLPVLAEALPIAVPRPARTGQPSTEYPWSWSILPWLAGQSADLAPLRADQSSRFGHFLRCLHAAAPANAPHNPVRGVPLASRAAITGQRLARLAECSDAITPFVRTAWKLARSAPIDTAPAWLHGDLHPQNILVEEGRISAVIDWGDLCAGDIACDLAGIWMLFAAASERQSAIEAYGGISPATRARSIGWAIVFGAMLLDSGLVDNPRHAQLGRRILGSLGSLSTPVSGPPARR